MKRRPAQKDRKVASKRVMLCGRLCLPNASGGFGFLPWLYCRWWWWDWRECCWRLGCVWLVMVMTPLFFARFSLTDRPISSITNNSVCGDFSRRNWLAGRILARWRQTKAPDNVLNPDFIFGESAADT